MSIEYACVTGLFVVGFGTLLHAISKAIISLDHIDLLLLSTPFG